MSTEVQLMTADELLSMPDGGYRYEIVKGRLVQLPFGTSKHGLVTMNLAGPLYNHIMANNLGFAYAAGTGFKIESEPDTVRAPDIAFVSNERLGLTDTQDTYLELAPDLAVEVTEDRDSVVGLEEKVEAWLVAGARLVWVVSPKLRTVTVHKSLTDVVTLTEKDQLEGGGVVPGFRMAVVEIFTA